MGFVRHLFSVPSARATDTGRGLPVAMFCAGLLTFFATDALAQNSTDNSADLTITLDADSTEASGRDGALSFRGIRIAQGDLSISADVANASGLDFRASTWTFIGDVKFNSGEADVSAGRAVLMFRDQQLLSADLSGPPVRFAQSTNSGANDKVVLTSAEARLEFSNRQLQRATFDGAPVNYTQTGEGTETTAQAGTVRVNQAGGTITLTDDALIREGSNEIRGNRITYNYLERNVVAAGDEERVTITITPPTEDPEEAPAP